MKCTSVRLPTAIVFALSLLMPAVRAEEPGHTAQSTAVQFVQPAQVDLSRLEPLPPEPGSPAAQADLDTELRVQAERTPADVAWADLVLREQYFTLFQDGGLLGPWFTPQNFPRLTRLAKALTDDSEHLEAVVKRKYSRPRPFLVDARIHPCVVKPKSGSYPSGHSMRAYLWAATLAEVFPEKRAALLERAHRIAWGRVIGGVHFPTDIEAGLHLGELYFDQARKNPEFQKLLEACREEARAEAGLTKAA